MPSASGSLEVIAAFMRDLDVEGSEGARITPESRLRDDLGLNSLAVLLLVVWIKDHVNADVFEQVGNVSRLVNVRDVLALMDSRGSPQAGA